MSISGNIVYLPVYLITCLKKESIGDVIYDIDLKGLGDWGL